MDHEVPFPADAEGPRGRQGSATKVVLPEGWMDDPEAASVPAHMRLSWFRSSMNIHHAFAICSFIDELATAAGKDSASYIQTFLAGPRRIDFTALQVDYPNYGAPVTDYPVDVGRMQAIVQLAMERGGWGEPVLPRQGRGIAVHRSDLT